MLTEMLLPPSAQLEIDETVVELDMIVIKARSEQIEAVCPVCGQVSNRVHRHYQRTIADLPWAERPVCFRLQVQRFFCDNSSCRLKTFAERFPGVVAGYGRRTRRLADRQRQTALV